MIDEKSEAERKYIRKIDSFSKILGWGSSAILISTPFAFFSIVYYGMFFIIILFIAVVMLILPLMVISILDSRAKKNFWKDFDLWYKILRPVQMIGISGIIATILMSILMYYQFNGNLFDPDLFIGIGIGICMYGSIYFFEVYSNKKWIGTRTRMFRTIKKAELENLFVGTLDSLNLKYSATSEGSRWTIIKDVLQVAPSIRIIIYDRGPGVQANIIPGTAEGIPLARHIEKAFDHVFDMRNSVTEG